MSYLIRDSNGVLFAEIDNTLAHKIIKECEGHFRQFKTSSKTVTVFNIDKDVYCYGNESFRIFLFKDTILIPDN